MMPTEPLQTNLDSRLTRVENSIARVEDQVAMLVHDFACFKERVEEMIEDHQTALYGDKGKPGLVGQSGTLEELRVALKGYGREPGLIAEIQELTNKMMNWDDGRKWVNRLVIGMLITEILLHLLGVGK
jgi:hypothetical protein